MPNSNIQKRHKNSAIVKHFYVGLFVFRRTSIYKQTLTEMKMAVSVNSLKFDNFSLEFGLHSCGIHQMKSDIVKFVTAELLSFDI